MPTNRQVYFELLKENNPRITRLIIKVLLNDVNGFSGFTTLYENFDKECKNYEDLKEKVQRIRGGEPFQYVLGYANFIDRDFYVNPSVLIPRQETEQLVVNTREIINRGFIENAPINIADICTGSGVIGITLKKYFPHTNVYMTDIDENCVEIAKKNAEKHNVDVHILKGNLLDPLKDKNILLDVLISNPPYIEDESEIDEQVYKYEPHLALLAKPAIKFYELIIKDAVNLVKKDGVIIFEIGENMEEALIDIASIYLPGASILFSKDLYGKQRFMYIIRQGE